MKIAFDLRAMDGASRYRGIGIYIVFMLNQLLPKLLDKNTVTIYVYDKQSLSDIESELLARCRVITVRPPFVRKLPSLLQKVFLGVRPREFARKNVLSGVEECDVFFQPYHEMGIPDSVASRSIVVAYDLIPLIFVDEYYNRASLSPNPKALFKYLRQNSQKSTYLKSLKQLKKASKILAISHSTQKDLEKLLGIESSKIATIHLGGPELPSGKVNKAFQANLKETPYITYVGGIDARRPIGNFLLHSGDIFIEQGIKTIVAGHDFEHIHDPSLKRVVEGGIKSGAISVLGHISEAEKHVLIENALAFVYPTLYEGFGIPILEAFMRRTPVITYRNSSITEVAGDAAIYVDSLEDVAREVEKLKDDKKHFNQIVKRGVAQSRKFSWEKCADETFKEVQNFKP